MYYERNNHYADWRSNSVAVNGYNSYYSIGLITSDNNFDYYRWDGLPNRQLHNAHGFASIFKTFRGIITDSVDFSLVDSIANNVLGNDGTQVGIYGGFMPFDPRVSGLNIRQLNVASRTTADGKLPVDIEIVSDGVTSTSEE